jgi:hypothetical protein
MDLSENGKCIFTSLQYVESSHAPYQRIRFFESKIFKKIKRSFENISTFWPKYGHGFRNLTIFFALGQHEIFDQWSSNCTMLSFSGKMGSTWPVRRRIEF